MPGRLDRRGRSHHRRHVRASGGRDHRQASREAARLESGRSSDLFATLADPAVASDLKLSGDQNGLIGRLDRAARDVQRAWLIRGIDDQPPPSTAELAERLAGCGHQLRAGLVTHFEAIAVEGVLEPSQANSLLKKLGRRSSRPLVGRYPRISAPSREPIVETKRWYDHQIRAMARQSAKSAFVSDLFRVFLGWDETRLDEPNPLKISDEQTKLIERLNKLVGDVQSDWLLRGLDGPNPVPRDHWEDLPTPRMVRRFEDRQRFQDSLAARAEEIVLWGVLEPRKAMIAKRQCWLRSGLEQLADPKMAGCSGIMALLDPEVASSLGISRSQREELVVRLEQRAIVADRLNGPVSPRSKSFMTRSGTSVESPRNSASRWRTGCSRMRG